VRNAKIRLRGFGLRNAFNQRPKTAEPEYITEDDMVEDALNRSKVGAGIIGDCLGRETSKNSTQVGVDLLVVIGLLFKGLLELVFLHR